MTYLVTFAIGDRVVIVESRGGLPVGTTATVVANPYADGRVRIRLDVNQVDWSFPMDFLQRLPKGELE